MLCEPNAYYATNDAYSSFPTLAIHVHHLEDITYAVAASYVKYSIQYSCWEALWDQSESKDAVLFADSTNN